MTRTFEDWLREVHEALAARNISLLGCQVRWVFDFSREFAAGTSPADAAEKASQFWQQEQSKAIQEHRTIQPDATDAAQQPSSPAPENSRFVDATDEYRGRSFIIMGVEKPKK